MLKRSALLCLLTLSATAAGAFAVPGVAQAAETCPAGGAVYTRAQLGAHVEAAEAALREGNNDALITVTGVLEDGLPCMSSTLPRRLAPTLYRLIGAGRFFASDVEGALSWFRTAVVGEPNGGFDVDELAADHPLRAVYERARDSVSEPEAVNGTLSDGVWYLDGSEISQPSARPGHRHVLQRVGAEGATSWVILGTTYPDAVTGGGGKVARDSKGGKPAKDPKAPKSGKPAKPEPAVASTTTVTRQRPPAKIPTIITGGVLVAASGGLLAGNLLSGQSFEQSNPTTEAEINSGALTTNALAVASGVVFAAGAGTLGWGIALQNGGARASFGFRF